MPKGGVEQIARSGRNAESTLAAIGRWARLSLHPDEHDALDAADVELIVLARALELAELHAVPEDAPAFVLFVCGPLFEAVAEVLGDAAARGLTEELTERAAPVPSVPPVAQVETRDDAPSAPEKRGSASRVVIVASGDAARSAAIRAAVERAAEVRCAADLAELVALIEANLERALVLVIDGVVPGAEGRLLLTLARLLPPSARLVLRGDPPSGLYAVSLSWATLPEEASVDDVAVRVLAEIGVAAPRSAERALVVVVSPEEVARSLMTRRLEHEGYLVIACEDGLAALEASIDHEPDLIVGELDMPGLDGLALARLVRSRMGDAAPRVLLRGSRALDADEARYATLVPADARFAELLEQARQLAPFRRL